MIVDTPRASTRRAVFLPLFLLAALGVGCGDPNADGWASHEASLKDTEPPQVSVTSPSDGATLSGQVTLSGLASDNRRVSRVEVRVDVGGFQLATGTTNWTFALDTTSLSDGGHTLTVRAVDNRGLSSQQTLTVTVKNAAAPTGGFVIDQALTLDRSTAAVGETITGTVRYRNDGAAAVTVQQLVIAARPPGADLATGPFWDFSPGLGALTVQPGQTVTLTASRTVSSTDVEGEYIAFATWQDGAGAWTKGPDVTFQVGSPQTCVPTTCADAGKNCGVVSDGCGGTLNCGGCVAPQSCGGGGVPNVCGTPSTSSAFVSVDPSTAQFMLNGKPFYFAGTNAYYLMQERTYGSAHSRDALDAAKAVGMTVVRTWGFADGYAWTHSGDPAILQITPGVYREQAFAALDWVVAEAGLRGLKLIIALVNNWDEYGGMNQYVRWAGRSGHDAFYTDPTVKQLYKNHVSAVLNRTNTLTGVQYKDDPTIMAWELANEGRCTSDWGASQGVMKAWVQEMASFVKSIDPNHLVASGEEGFDDTSSGYSSYGSGWLFNGSQGTSFTANTQLAGIDFAGVHLYPQYWNLTNTEAHQWITDHRSKAAGFGKPLIVGEFGSSDRSVYQGWLNTVASSGTAGALVWELVPKSRGAYEATDVLYPDDTSLVTVLKDHAAQMNAK